MWYGTMYRLQGTGREGNVACTSYYSNWMVRCRVTTSWYLLVY